MQERLLILRKKHNLSQEAMAKYLSITATQYGRKERDVNAFNADEMFMIKYLFDKPLEEIFTPRDQSNHKRKERV